jgi:hypothetical protein
LRNGDVAGGSTDALAAEIRRSGTL